MYYPVMLCKWADFPIVGEDTVETRSAVEVVPEVDPR